MDLWYVCAGMWLWSAELCYVGSSIGTGRRADNGAHSAYEGSESLSLCSYDTLKILQDFIFVRSPSDGPMYALQRQSYVS